MCTNHFLFRIYVHRKKHCFQFIIFEPEKSWYTWYTLVIFLCKPDNC